MKPKNFLADIDSPDIRDAVAQDILESLQGFQFEIRLMVGVFEELEHNEAVEFFIAVEDQVRRFIESRIEPILYPEVPIGRPRLHIVP